MQVVGHENRFVQQIGSCLSVMEQLGDHNLSDLVDLKDGNILSGLCRDEVGASVGRAVKESSHDSESSAAKAGCVPSLLVGPEGPTP